MDCSTLLLQQKNLETLFKKLTTPKCPVIDARARTSAFDGGRHTIRAVANVGCDWEDRRRSCAVEHFHRRGNRESPY